MQVRPGIKVRHFKGGQYEIVGIGRHSETDEQLVVYRPLGDSALKPEEDFWVRPLSLFTEIVQRDEYHGPRFSLIE